MMPIGFEQLAQRSPVDAPKTVEPDGGGFEELLVQVQSLQWTALANTSAQNRTLGLDQDVVAGGARELRIKSETQAARQAEVSSQRTRGADPTSVQNGVVSERHERVLAQKDASIEGQRTADFKSKTTESNELRSGGIPIAKAAIEAKPASELLGTLDQTKNQSKATPPNVSASNAATPEKKTASDSTSPAQTASKAVQVTTVGAARAAMGDGSLKQGASAQQIGQLLTGRVQATRATSSGTQVYAVRDGAGKNASQPAANKAQNSAPTSGRSSVEDTVSTKRSVFEGLVKSIRMNRGAKSSSATIRLDPPDLGKMKIHAQMSDDVLRVRVEASSPGARRLLAERSDELVAALRERGIDVDRFEVVKPDAVQNELSRDEDSGETVLDQPKTMRDGEQQAPDRNADSDDETVGTLGEKDRGQAEENIETVGQEVRLDVRI